MNRITVGLIASVIGTIVTVIALTHFDALTCNGRDAAMIAHVMRLGGCVPYEITASPGRQ